MHDFTEAARQWRIIPRDSRARTEISGLACLRVEREVTRVRGRWTGVRDDHIMNGINFIWNEMESALERRAFFSTSRESAMMDQETLRAVISMNGEQGFMAHMMEYIAEQEDRSFVQYDDCLSRILQERRDIADFLQMLVTALEQAGKDYAQGYYYNNIGGRGRNLPPDLRDADEPGINVGGDLKL